MRKAALTTLIVIGLMVIACSNDEDKAIHAQEHDKNILMNKMHTMMDQMTLMTMSKDPDLDFANMMILHHKGAIEMANYELQNGADAQIKAMAQDVIDAQQQEIQQMEAIINGIPADQTDNAFAMELMKSMDKMGITADTQLITGDTDHDFATLMIVHHQSALDNALVYLHHGNNAELKAMANMMVEMQTKEIIDFGNWLVAN
ncbi:DUF305 domain-containing protein [Flavobacterium sp. F-65]|uniref:DUF305 domain-containing protein n=1 Tax=Flavobacterium pisciphilum TaxID=2893755 RepID=A0ABS8MQE8_9FLAO|nr:DUF305 domain-containing protein [Flavobacterium sp. F-65]MCC9070985.1 DUF305 domain-containing protein [Flavobacterium sp. F-65]PAM94594.1 hypothetical protein B4N84_11480 [Flavobacterium sp. IR1]